MLGATVQNSAAMATWLWGIVHPCLRLWIVPNMVLVYGHCISHSHEPLVSNNFVFWFYVRVSMYVVVKRNNRLKAF
jgi:hypothetical protein